MAKWSGKIGFMLPEVEVRPGVWKPESVIEKQYRGDLTKDFRRTNSTSDSVNDNITLNNQLSIVANPFVMENFYAIRYVIHMGVAWKVTSIDSSQRPRLVLTLGGVYNGKQT